MLADAVFPHVTTFNKRFGCFFGLNDAELHINDIRKRRLRTSGGISAIASFSYPVHSQVIVCHHVITYSSCGLVGLGEKIEYGLIPRNRSSPGVFIFLGA